MANKNLTEVLAACNMGEDDDRVIARLSEDGKNTEVGYMAYGGLRVIELTGNLMFADINQHVDLVKELHNKVGDDFEVMLAIDTGNGIAMVSVDSMSELTSVGADISIKVESSDSYDAEDFEGAEAETPLMDWMNAFEL